MAETLPDLPVAVVRLWGRRVAAVAEDAAGGITFEFDEDFRRSGLEVSPLHLPLSREGLLLHPPALNLAGGGCLRHFLGCYYLLCRNLHSCCGGI